MNGTMKEVRPGIWRLRVYAGRRPNGTPIQLTETLDTAGGRMVKPGAGKREAQRALAAMVAKVSKGAATGTESVAELVDLWLDHLGSLGRSPTTLHEYRRIARVVVVPELGNVKVRALTARQLDGLYAKLSARGLAATSVRRVHALISAALHQGERWGVVDENVARRATPPPIRPEPVEVPSPAQVRAIVEQAEEKDPAVARFLLMAALTGARRGELCALRWTDVDLPGRTITIARSLYESAGGRWAEKPTKTHQVRRVALDDLGVEVMCWHRKAVDELADRLELEVLTDGFVWSVSPVGTTPYSPKAVTRAASVAAKKAGVTTHLHAFRHFSATQAIGGGSDVVTVAGRLGHRDPSVTLRVYSHALEQRDQEAAAAIGASLAGALGTGAGRKTLRAGADKRM